MKFCSCSLLIQLSRTCLISGCLTVANSNGKDSAAINKPCVFPWKYSSDGPSFNGCANPYENEGGNWCAKGLNQMEIYVSGSNNVSYIYNPVATGQIEIQKILSG